MAVKEYYGLPAWFADQFSGAGNGSLLNVRGSAHYIGRGFDEKKKIWTDGGLLTDFELGLPLWKREAEEADFIVHFGREL
jgi:hypothetical protein